jgi:hypothetical protein
MTEQIKYCLRRHGEKDKEGNLVEGEIPKIYFEGATKLADFYRKRNQNRGSCVVHTSAKRTRDTGLVVLAGALELSMPKSLRDINEICMPEGSVD